MNNYRYVNDTPPEYSPKKLSMKSTAQILGYEFGYKTLYRILRECGVLDQYNNPQKEFIKHGYFTQDTNYMRQGYEHWQTYVLGQKGLEFVRSKVDEYLSNNTLPKGKRRCNRNKGRGYKMMGDV